MSVINILVKSIDDKFVTLKGDSVAPASSTIIRALRDLEGADANPNEYKVLVAYQLLQPELELEKLYNRDENDQLRDAKTISLDSLDIKTGHYLIFIKPITVTTKLVLDIGGKTHHVTEQGYKVGREDPDNNIFPNLDLTLYLGDYERKVSRSLISFIEFNGKWKVILDPNARTNVFVDGEKLRHGEEKDIGGTINIGNSPENPYLKIKTTVIGG